MANGLYTAYRSRTLGSGSLAVIDWDTDTVKGVFCSASYAVNLATHAALSDVTSGARIATATLTGLTITAGAVIPSGTYSFTPGSSATVTSLVIYKDTGTATTSPLAAYIDTFASGMPFAALNGVAFNVNFDATGVVIL